MKTLKFLGAAVLACGLGGQAIAEDSKFEPYGSVEGWNIFIDKEKKSCLIEAVDMAENVVQMGLTADRSIGYIGVFTRAKTNIKKGEIKPIAIVLGENIYVGESMGMRGNITKGYSGGYILTNDPQMVVDVAQQYEMIVFPDEEYSFIVDLAGTKKAIEAARECNAKALEG